MSNSFQFATPAELTLAREVVTLDHVSVCQGTGIPRRRNSFKNGCESWACMWSPDMSYLAWSAGHGMVILIPWNLKLQHKQDPNDVGGLDGRQYNVIDCGEMVYALAFGLVSNTSGQRWKQCGDGTSLVLATGHVSGRIKLWNGTTGKLLVEIMDHKDIVHDLHFMENNSLYLASASMDGSVKLWEFDEQGDCNMYLTIRTNTKHAYTCRWSPDGKHVAAAGSFKTALLFRVEGRQVLNRMRLDGHNNDVVQCDFSPDGALLATASYDTQVIIWDVHLQTIIAKLGHLYPRPRLIYAGGANDHFVYCVKFSPEGTRLASVGEDGYVRVWQMPDLSDPVMIASVEGARCCSFSASGQLLVVGTLSGSMTVLATPREQVQPLAHACRHTVRSIVTPTNLSTLPIPEGVMAYLAYKDIVCD